jgi:hypothetical protein
MGGVILGYEEDRARDFARGYYDQRDIDYGIRPTDEWMREGQDLRRDEYQEYVMQERQYDARGRRMDDRIYFEARQRGLDFVEALRQSRIVRARRMIGALKSDEEPYLDLDWYFR